MASIGRIKRDVRNNRKMSASACKLYYVAMYILKDIESKLASGKLSRAATKTANDLLCKDLWTLQEFEETTPKLYAKHIERATMYGKALYRKTNPPAPKKEVEPAF